MSHLETDPEKILAANMARREKAVEFDELFRENSVVNIMSAQIHDLQKDRDRLYKRVQNLEQMFNETAAQGPTNRNDLVTWGGVVNDLSEVREKAFFYMDGKFMMKTGPASFIILKDRAVMDRIERMLNRAEALDGSTPVDNIDPKWVAQGGH